MKKIYTIKMHSVDDEHNSTVDVVGGVVFSTYESAVNYLKTEICTKVKGDKGRYEDPAGNIYIIEAYPVIE